MNGMTTKLSNSMELTRGPAWSSRFALAPLTNLQSHPDGTLSDYEYAWLVKRSEGGFPLVMTCAAHVQQGGQGFPGQLGVFSDAHLPGLERLAAGIRAGGAVSSVQIQHSGERSEPKLSGCEVLAPFDNAELGARALTTGEVEQLIEDFIAAAVRSEKAGFDGVEIHGAHGYMLCEFLDERRNLRGDRYGVSYENRTRIFHEIIAGIRARTRTDFQLGVRLSPERFGCSTAEARRFAQELMTGGQIDYLDMSLWDCFKTPEDEAFKSGPLIDWFTNLERGSTRLGVAGKILSAQTAQTCLEHGADFVFIGRGAILHHDFPRLALADSSFAAMSLPVTRSHLEAEAIGPPFLDYLSTQWRNFVSA